IIGFGGANSKSFINQLSPEAMKDFTKLSLVAAKLTSALSIPRDKLEEVMLWGVHDDKTSSLLGRFIKKCRSVEFLTCWAKGFLGELGRRKSDIDLEKDLISQNLSRFAVSCALLVVRPSASLDTYMKPNLTELYTDF